MEKLEIVYLIRANDHVDEAALTDQWIVGKD